MPGRSPSGAVSQVEKPSLQEFKITRDSLWRRTPRLQLTSHNRSLTQISYPTSMDVGWGNMNVGTAIQMLRQYLTRTGAGEIYAGDPLGLRQYADNYARLARDLANPRSDLTVKMSGLLLSKADEIFANAYQTQYLSLPEQDQAQLLVTASKQGLSKIA